MIYKNGAKDITIEQCLKLWNLGVVTIFDNGTDVTFKIKKVGDKN